MPKVKDSNVKVHYACIKPDLVSVLHHRHIRQRQTALSATRNLVTSVSASHKAAAEIKLTLSKFSVWRADSLWFLEDLNVVFDNVKCGFGHDDSEAKFAQLNLKNERM